VITPAEWKFEEYHAAAAAAVQEDIKLNKLVYKLVPRKLTESDFWRLYFSEVLFVLDSVKAHGQYPPPVRAARQSHMRGTACLSLSRSRALARALSLSLSVSRVCSASRACFSIALPLLPCAAAAAAKADQGVGCCREEEEGPTSTTARGVGVILRHDVRTVRLFALSCA